jgi:hypothetical protein
VSPIKLYRNGRGYVGFTWPLEGVTPAGLRIPRLTLWSHSWGDGAMELDGTNFLGQHDDARWHRFDQHLASALGLSWPNFIHRGYAGSSLLSYYGQIQTECYPRRNGTAPYLSTSGHHAMLIGQNDAELGNPDLNAGQVRRAYKMAVRTCLARFRAGRVFEDTDPLITYPGGGWIPGAGSVGASKGTVAVCSLPGGRVRFAVPADYTGTHVNMRFRGEVGATGCTSFTVTAPGGFSITDSTANTIPALHQNGVTGTFGTVNIRVPLAPTGTVQNVDAVANSFTGGGVLAFDCAEIEDHVIPGFVAWATIAKPRDWYPGLFGPSISGGAAKRTGSAGSPTDFSMKNVAGTPPLGAQPGDTWAASLNAAAMEAIAEFGRPVFSVPIDLDIDGTQHIDQWGDCKHPNALGNIALGRRFRDTIAAQGFTADELDTAYATRDAALGLVGRR